MPQLDGRGTGRDWDPYTPGVATSRIAIQCGLTYGRLSWRCRNGGSGLSGDRVERQNRRFLRSVAHVHGVGCAGSRRAVRYDCAGSSTESTT
jgi:hypothetical protein